MKAHCEAVWNKFKILTNNNPQIWPCLQLYAGCALLLPPKENFRLGHVLVRPIFLICCTTLSALGLRSLWMLLSTGWKGCAHHSFSTQSN